MSARERAEQGAAAQAGAEWVECGLLRLPLLTPTLPPATTTNHVLCGRESAIIVDPSCPDPAGLRRVMELVRDLGDRAGWRFSAIVLTHHHRDHIGMAAALAAATGLPIRCHAATRPLLPFEAQGDIEECATIAIDGADRWLALHTPGHAPGHLVLQRAGPDRPGATIVGDLVAAVGTILIDPQDGEMGAYLASLERIAALQPRLAIPAHGGVIEQPAEHLLATAAHRRAREDRVLQSLDVHLQPDDALLPSAYRDTPRRLWPLALRSLRAHLLHLEQRGLAAQVDGRWKRVD